MDFDTYERGLWAGRAAAYERGFARLTAHAAGALLDAAGVAAGTRVLDVGTGPGVVAGATARLLSWEHRVDPGEWWEEVYLSRVGSNGVVIGRQDTATVARIKDEFDGVVARYAVDAGQVALPAVAVLGSGQRPDRSVTYPSGTHVVFTAPGSATNGQYGLFEWNMTGTRGGANPHFHKTFSESFYVMEGTVRLFNGETWIDAVKGDFLYVPQGGIHAFSNESGTPARMLILFAPGPPREKYFTELADIRSAGRKLTEEEWIEVWAPHDQYPA